MITHLRLLALSLCFLVAPASLAIAGYYNYFFYPGDNLFQNNLSTEPKPNTLSFVLNPLLFPLGTTISLWSPTADAFTITSDNLGGTSWSVDFQLAPGTGAKLTLPVTATAFPYTFLGDPLNHDGSPLWDVLTPPPPFTGPNGIYLLGDKCPIASTGDNVFLNILGRGPNPGEQFTRLDASTQTYLTSTYLGGGLWDIVPHINVGEAGFFNISAVPEPSSLSLALLGFALLRRFRRQP